MAQQVTWEQVLAGLREEFSKDEVEIERVKELLSGYKSNPEDWSKFALFDPHRYTRNLVDDGNGKYNVMLLCWNLGQASSIHSHAGSHCFMKVLDGNLLEDLYPPPDTVKEGSHMQPNVETDHPQDAVLYISDKIGMHRVENQSHSKVAVSLHVYSPPYSECLCFDERTGHARSSGQIKFYSRYGEVTENSWQSGIAECREMDQ